jgi:hypothetical protein
LLEKGYRQNIRIQDASASRVTDRQGEAETKIAGTVLIQ